MAEEFGRKLQQLPDMLETVVHIQQDMQSDNISSTREAQLQERKRKVEEEKQARASRGEPVCEVKILEGEDDISR